MRDKELHRRILGIGCRGGWPMWSLTWPARWSWCGPYWSRLESINGRIGLLKIHARGFCNKERFIWSIHFYPGGLDLHANARQHALTHTIR